MESSLFEDLLCFLQKEELVLKALRATDLKACLRTGTGTRGYEANAERAKYYRIYNKIEKQVTADQKAILMDWERRLCSEAEDIDFARLLTILENRQDDLRQMQKTSLEACFNSSLSNTDKEVRSVKCGVWSLSLECEARSVKCEVWGLECEGSSGKWEVWSVDCEVRSVKCEVWSVKFQVRSAKSAVWSVECEDFASSLAEKIKRLSREGHGRDRVSLNYRSFMFGKLPPPACPGLCYIIWLLRPAGLTS